MAEFWFREQLKQRGIEKDYRVESRATSTEEIGNPPHRGTVAKLAEYGIAPSGKYAEQLTRRDYERYDLIIGMDSANIRNILRIVGSDKLGKVHKLTEFAGSDRDIADPWYTGNFDETFRDISEGCDGLMNYLGK